ncbi:hypothetical protein [Variovorax sp. OV329]|uniref:hypothetical protein n=1 Tax=Variovorax sp. OV329 TaxID=1882825 RepID=UPI0008E8C7EC|nr:hypothetical protein [Variovorax sp. OV329]SFN34410.1 hypothetical protein SAMN05444747_12262 [Variovorax sp. OV329]
MAYSIQSTVNELMASDSAKAIVDRYLPGASSHPRIALAGGMRLATVAQLAGNLLPQETLDKIDAELRSL